jgi:dihydrofolate reductase
MIIGIVAISKNFAIGKNGKLPWHYPSDLKFFKQTTTGNSIAMGWNTWKSIGKPLPNRLNIVLSRRGELAERPDLRLMRSSNEVLEFSTHAAGDLFIIGGSETYKTFADWIEKWYVTEVPLEVEDADTFMPHNFLDGFELQSKVDLDDGLVVKVFKRK